MKEFLVRGVTLPETYHRALLELRDQSEISITMEVRHPLAEPRISRLFPGGPYDLCRYELEITEGIFNCGVDQGLWHYTYHQRFAPWIRGVLDELRDNPDSRRACISVRDNQADEGSTDPACLQHIQFMIRDGKLDMYVLFRSNDAVRAAYMNAFALIRLQERISSALGVPVGRYIHRANNFHCYPESRETLDKYIDRITSHGETTYNYSGDWKILMKDCIPAIYQEAAAQLQKSEGKEGYDESKS